MYRTPFQCRLLTTVRMPDDGSDIPENECGDMLAEYLDQLRSYITTNSYSSVDDALDTLICLFDGSLGSKKKARS